MSKNTVNKYSTNTLYYTLTSKYIFAKLKAMRYTFKDFKAEYPDDKACLISVLENRYGKTCPRCGVVGVKFHPITGRKGFVCSECDRHIYPLADTIFRKSETSLWNWFYAIYLFSVSKNGVSAKELERHLGVTYKTAWRIAKQIRLLMAQDGDKLSGVVEADETYIGGRNVGAGSNFHNKTPILGATEKDGNAKAQVTDWASTSRAKSFLRATLEVGSELHTDESPIYTWTKHEYKHGTVNHSAKQYVYNGIHTNTIEGFWSQLKRSIDGTYHVVSPKYLQSYLNEFVFRYNHRELAVCPVLLERAATLS